MANPDAVRETFERILGLTIELDRKFDRDEKQQASRPAPGDPAQVGEENPEPGGADAVVFRPAEQLSDGRSIRSLRRVELVRALRAEVEELVPHLERLLSVPDRTTTGEEDPEPGGPSSAARMPAERSSELVDRLGLVLGLRVREEGSTG